MVLKVVDLNPLGRLEHPKVDKQQGVEWSR